jgi:hypothetical protein
MITFGVLAALAIVVSLVYALVGVLVARRLHRGVILEGHNEVLAPVFATVGTIYAVILAFLLFGVWTDYVAARAIVADEASTLASLYRQTAALPQEPRTAMRKLLRAYADAVVNDEWDLMDQDKMSPKASRALVDIYRATGGLDPAVAALPIISPFLSNVSVLTADRNKRALFNEQELPNILWLLLIGGGAIVVGMAFLLYMERRWPHVLMVCAMACFIGGILFTTYALDQPFTGWYALDTDAFDAAIVEFDAVDKGG